MEKVEKKCPLFRGVPIENEPKSSRPRESVRYLEVSVKGTFTVPTQISKICNSILHAKDGT